MAPSIPLETGPRFSMVVLPFANLTGDPGWDYLGKDMGVELTTLMGAFPNMHVVAGAAPGEADQDVRRAARAAGARYVEEERRSWSKDKGSLDAYDYYLRGASLFLRLTQADNEKARVIFEEGLKK
jgi:hypothetical protein